MWSASTPAALTTNRADSTPSGVRTPVICSPTDVESGDGARAVHVDAVSRGQLRVADGQPQRVDDPVLGDVQGRDRTVADQRLERAGFGSAHDLGLGVVCPRLLEQGLEARVVVCGERHAQRAEPFEWRVERGAQRLPARGGAAHELGFERAGGAVSATGRNPRVALRSALAHVMSRLEQCHRCSGERQPARDRTAHHATAHDHHVVVTTTRHSRGIAGCGECHLNSVGEMTTTGRMERGLYIAAAGMIAEQIRRTPISDDLANAVDQRLQARQRVQSSFSRHAAVEHPHGAAGGRAQPRPAHHERG